MNDERVGGSVAGSRRVGGAGGGASACALAIFSALGLMGGLLSTVVDAQQAAGTTVEDPRPVAKAMATLSRQLGWNITYEDPAYVNVADLVDVTKSRVGGRRAIIPRGGRVSLPTETALASAERDPVALLESVLGTEETSRGRVKRFRVLRSASMFHVVPDKVLDEAGLWQTATPVLGTMVSVSYGITNLSEFLERLCADVGAVSGRQVKVGRIPTTLALRTTVPAQERTATARTLLADALSLARQPLSWLLMYDPSSTTFYLHVVPPGTF